MGFQYRLTRVYIVIIAVQVLTTAAQFPSRRASHINGIEPQLSLIMEANAQMSRDTELLETWAWLEHLSSKPACTQLATSKLTAEFQLLDNPSNFDKAYPDQVLEDVQNEYALKLAICEYVGPQSSHPKAPHGCHSFLPSTEACTKRSWWSKAEAITDELCYAKATKADLQRCLSTMQASPQTWTSYSNARSRAMHICHLTRQHIETERAIQVHKNLTLVVAKMHDLVQPLESKMQAMNDQLLTFSDDFQRSFEQSQQAADEFTIFAKAANKKYQDHLEEANEGLRNVQSELAASQQQINEHYSSLQSQLDHHLSTSLARNEQVMVQRQDESLAQFAMAVERFFQARATELSERLSAHKEDLQEYHTKTMLGLQQHHETTVHSLDILNTGIYGASSEIGDLNEKIVALKDELDGSIAKVEMVNEGLGSLASLAQTAGRILGQFEAFARYFGLGGILVVLIILMNCIPGVAIFGRIARKLTTITLMAITCGAFYYSISQFIPVHSDVDVFAYSLPAMWPSEQVFAWTAITLCIILLACSLFIFRYYAPSLALSLCTLSSIRERLSRRQGLTATQRRLAVPLSPKTQSSTITTPLPQGDMDQPSHPIRSNKTTCVENASLSKETQEDEDLRNRIRTFQRATTVS